MKYEACLSVNKLQYYKIVQASLNLYVIGQRKNCTEKCYQPHHVKSKHVNNAALLYKC